jgi:hypothetical protein
MAEPVQNYKNHARTLPPFHFFVVPVLFLNVVNTIRHIVIDPSRHTAWEFVVASALLTLALMSRMMAVTVQDRVIRLEMQQRLARVLPPDLQARSSALTYRQLIALRFASDAELPGLCREVLEGRLQTGKEIKQRVQNWQADRLRA